MAKRGKKYVQNKENAEIKVNHVENLDTTLQQEDLSNKEQSEVDKIDVKDSDIDVCANDEKNNNSNENNSNSNENMSEYLKGDYDKIILLNKDQIKELKKKGKTSLVIKSKSKKKMFLSSRFLKKMRNKNIELCDFLMNKYETNNDVSFNNMLLFIEQINNTKIYVKKNFGISMKVESEEIVKVKKINPKLNSKKTGYIFNKEIRSQLNITFKKVD